MKKVWDLRTFLADHTHKAIIWGMTSGNRPALQEPEGSDTGKQLAAFPGATVRNCPSRSVLGHPQISVTEEGILSLSIYKTQIAFYPRYSEKAQDQWFPERKAVLQTEHSCNILLTVSCTEIQS